MLNKKIKYEDNFKKQIVNLFKNEKSALEITKEYRISGASVYK